MRTVDKLDKIGASKVKELLVEGGVSEDSAQEILHFIGISGGNQAVLAALETYRGRNEVFDAGLDELTTVVKYLAAFGVPETHFAVDLTIARGLDYYTGTVYETTMLDHRRSAPSVPAAVMITWRNITLINNSPALEFPSV